MSKIELANGDFGASFLAKVSVAGIARHFLFVTTSGLYWSLRKEGIKP